MPRKQRVFIPGAVCHVYCRVVRGEFVFDDEVEARNWANTVFDVVVTHDLVVFAWCLLSTTTLGSTIWIFSDMESYDTYSTQEGDIVLLTTAPAPLPALS